MAVKIGSARIDENGNTRGGKAGNQNGNEVSTQSWYLHSKGWIVLRAKSAEVREKIAKCMEMACKNKHIGYDQGQRDTLYTEAKKFDFDLSKVTKDVETDCSALVRVCCGYAGITVKSFNTTVQVKTLMATGAFEQLTDDEHCKKSTLLLRGDILVTKTQGHTVVVLSNGTKAVEPSEPTVKVLKKGSKGNDVRDMQSGLIALGYDLEPYGADGDFGTVTRAAVKEFQTDSNLKPDGQYGPLTDAAMTKALHDLVAKSVRVTGGTVSVRTAPNTKGERIGFAKKGEIYEYQGINNDGWYLIIYKGQNAWISGKYSEVV